MIAIQDLRTIARTRLNDAEHLLRGRQFDGGVYLCGYAVELALKARICRTLKWHGFPGTQPEFRGYQSFRTHDLKVLLHLSGREDRVKSALKAEWREVSWWSPDARYTAGTATRDKLITMIESTRKLLRVL